MKTVSKTRELVFVVLNRVFHRVYRRQQLQFWERVGCNPNIALPGRYHEKMLWRKLFDRNPLFEVFCDKLATKEFIRERAPGLKVPETLWVGESADKIPATLLERPIAIKCNHSSSSNWFWRPGVSDLKAIAAEAEIHLSQPYGMATYETDYKNVPRLLFAEEMIEGVEGEGVLDINIRCADGKAFIASIIAGNKTENMQVGYFELDGERSEFDRSPAYLSKHLKDYKSLPTDFAVPEVFAKAVEFGELLSRGIDYARFDFLAGRNGLYAGEITIYPAAGLTPAADDAVNTAEGRVNLYWDLRKSWFLSNRRKGWRRCYAKLLSQTLN